MVVYTSAYEYIHSTTDLLTQIDKIKQIISALTQAMLDGAPTSNILEYSLDTGQSKMKTVYKGAQDIVNQISALEKLCDIYIVKYNKLNNGNIVRLIDSKNLKGGF